MKARAVLALLALFTLSSALAVSAGGAKVVWDVPGDFVTIQDAVDSPMVLDGDMIRIGNGAFAGATLAKSLTIVGNGKSIIDDGPPHSSGLIQGFRMLAGSDGSRIAQLELFVDLAIMNADGVDDVEIDHNRFHDAIQAISNWRGSSWNIHHNRITDLRTRCGGGIGILVGDYADGEVTGNLVEHNTIEGTLNVSPDDCGGYAGSGIVLFADFRFGRAGSTAIRNNRVTFNKIAMTSDTPAVVDIVAFELTDSRDDATATPFPVLFDNAVGFNDFRRTDNQIALTPAELADHNVLSRNLGDNRGHGVHPGMIFDPGS